LCFSFSSLNYYHERFPTVLDRLVFRFRAVLRPVSVRKLSLGLLKTFSHLLRAFPAGFRRATTSLRRRFYVRTHGRGRRAYVTTLAISDWRRFVFIPIRLEFWTISSNLIINRIEWHLPAHMLKSVKPFRL